MRPSCVRNDGTDAPIVSYSFERTDVLTHIRFLGLGLMAAVLAAVGCGDKAGKPITRNGKPALKTPVAIHAHGMGPNGGVLFDLGKYHGEFTVDHDKQECSVLVQGADEKTPKAVVARNLILTTRETKTKDGKSVAAMTVKMTPRDEKDGKATRFVGTDPGLGCVADFAGTLTGEIDGKPSSGEFKE